MFDREDNKPNNLTVEMLDAFTVKLNWGIEEASYVDKFSIYRAESDTLVLNDFEFTLIGTIFDSLYSSEDSEGTFSYNDTTAVYRKWNHYYVVSHYKGKSSLLSDTDSIYFEINSPEVAVDTIDPNLIMQTYSAWNNYVNGIVIKRKSQFDTLFDTLLYVHTGEKQITLYDSLLLDYTSSPIDSFIGRPLFDYEDIKPNVHYHYSAQNFQIKDDSTRYSRWSESVGIRLHRNTVFFKTRAYSDSSVRIYLSNQDPKFDKALVYLKDSNQWDIYDSTYIDDYLISYEGERLWDLIYTDPLQNDIARIVLIGENSYSISNVTDTLCHLEIGGFVLVEGGEFKLGCVEGDNECEEDERPPDQDTTILSFYLSIYEVTENDFLNDTWNPQKDDLPIDEVSWLEAQFYCSNVLSSIYPNLNLIFRLPTEAEWEYAAKHDLNGNDAKYPWGNDIDIYHANYGDANGGLVGVGQYPFPSSFGIYDMAGNVLEWVSNCYNDTLGLEPSDTTNCWKVARGGGYWHNPEDLRTTKRFHYPQDQSIEGVGFRIVMKVNQ